MLLGRLPILVVIFALVATSVARGDEILLRNGDRVSGKITEVGESTITIDTSLLGTITAQLNDVREFRIGEPPVTAPTGAAAVAATRPATTAPATPTTVATTQPATAPTTSVAATTKPVPPGLAKPPEKPAVKRWSGSVVASAAATRGNADTESFKLTANAVRKGENEVLTLGGGYSFAQQKSQTTGDRNTTADHWWVSAKVDHSLGERWYDYALIRVERDNVADLALRVSPGVGVGYRWIKSPEMNFNTEAGINWVWEDYQNNGSRDHFAVRLAYHFDKKLNDKVSFVHNLEYLPNIVDPLDYNLNVDAGLKTMLTKSLSLEVKAEWRRDSTPAPGAEKNDLRYTLGVGWNF